MIIRLLVPPSQFFFLPENAIIFEPGCFKERKILPQRKAKKKILQLEEYDGKSNMFDKESPSSNSSSSVRNGRLVSRIPDARRVTRYSLTANSSKYNLASLADNVRKHKLGLNN